MKEFNDKQQQVINNLEDNLVVIASAGTGKTETLAERVVNIINCGKASPKEILCITFTNKACREMQERIQEIVGEKSKEVTIKTFHSWCFDLIKKEAKKRTDIFTDFIIYDEEDSKAVVETIKRQVKVFDHLPITSDKLFEFIVLIKEAFVYLKLMKKENYDISRVIDYIYENKKIRLNEICTEKKRFNVQLRQALKNEGSDLIKQYNQVLESNRGLDFTDIMIHTQELLMQEDLIQTLQRTYRYINVDEIQDTNLVEYGIIQKIFGSNKILLCGDIFQTIYEWRGSAPQRILKHFSKKYHAINVVFNKNYRATKNLVNISVQYLNNAFPEIVSKLYKEPIQVFSTIQGNRVTFKESPNIDEEVQYIYQVIKENKLTIDKTCILTRDNTYNGQISKILSKLQKPTDAFEFTLVDQFKFFRREEVKDILAFMKLVANKHDAISLRRILKQFKTGVGDKTLAIIEDKKYREMGIKLTDFINYNRENNSEPFGKLIEAFKANNIIVYDVESTGIDPTEDEIIQIAAIKIDNKGKVINTFDKFLKNRKPVGKSEQVHTFSDEFLQKKGEDKVKVLKEFVKFSRDSVIVGHNVSFDINILTSEIAKSGLEKPKIKIFYDTLDIYRRFYPNLENHKLETLSEIFKTAHKPSHNALDDILATAELLVKVLEDKITPTASLRSSAMREFRQGFIEIADKLQILYECANMMKPSELVTKIVINWRMKEQYTKEKVANLYKFYDVVKELENPNKNNTDALLDILKITGLSNGEMELMLLKNHKKVNIPIITVHQAKGLEFDTVFLAGIQENRFPSYRAVKQDDLEEEKRTFYVAITRAKQKLYISCNTQGNYYNSINKKSRLLTLLPQEYIDIV